LPELYWEQWPAFTSSLGLPGESRSPKRAGLQRKFYPVKKLDQISSCFV
jgi:hypothetical protein